MLMGEFATAVQYSLPIKVIVIKNDTLGMIRWEQMGFLGNPEFGVEFSPIDWVKFAEACGGKGYAIKEPNEVKSIMHQAMKERKPTIIEAYVDPFEPPMPPKVEMEFVKEVAKSFAKGQPYARRIGLTLYRDKVHEVLKRYILILSNVTDYLLLLMVVIAILLLLLISFLLVYVSLNCILQCSNDYVNNSGIIYFRYYIDTF